MPILSILTPLQAADENRRALLRRHGFTDLEALDTGGCTVHLMARLPPALHEHEAAPGPAAAAGALVTAEAEVPAGGTQLALLSGGVVPEVSWKGQ